MDSVERGALFEQAFEDVPLADAPIIRVIGQLRFGTLSVLQAGDQAAREFVGSLAAQYPYSEQGTEHLLQVTIGQSGQPVQQAGGPIWRLRSADQLSTVALSSSSLTYETSIYTGRTQFCGTLEGLASALVATTNVPAFSRVAVRYTNRMVGLGTKELRSFFHPELLGVVGAADDGPAQQTHALSQSIFAFGGPGQNLLAQWGILPQGASIDPALAPATEPSWILDLDSFVDYPDISTALLAKPGQVSKVASECAERAYRFFRWSVTDEFLRVHGGEL